LTQTKIDHDTDGADYHPGIIKKITGLVSWTMVEVIKNDYAISTMRGFIEGEMKRREMQDD
jgi:hypothetical protein